MDEEPVGYCGIGNTGRWLRSLFCRWPCEIVVKERNVDVREGGVVYCKVVAGARSRRWSRRHRKQ